MDAMVEEQLDYGDEDFAGNPKLQNGGVGGGAIPAFAEDEMIDDDDEFDGLYNDVNVGEHFTNHHQQNPNLKPLKPNPNTAAAPFGGSNNGSLLQAQLPDPKIEPPVNTCMPGFKAPPQNPNVGNNFDFSSSRVPEYAMTQFTAAKVSPATAVPRPAVGPVDVNGPTVLFVGDLHWWTTDADLESVVTQYGRLKEIKFFDERASGKSKGYCQVEFYDASAAAACKEGMDGYEFNGRACVVAFASPQTLRQMGASYANQGQGPSQQQQGRRQMNDGTGRGGGGGGGGDGGGRNFGRGGWGSRGGQGMVNRGQGGGTRGRGFAGGKAMVGAGGGVGNNGPYGPGLGGPAGLRGPIGMMHPQNMMGAGFDPTFMGRGGPYGFHAPVFPGMMPPFQALNAVGLQGVAPHVNPAFFGHGMSANGAGVMGSNGMEGQMWGDTGIGGGWTGEEHGRTRESSYGVDDEASEYGYGKANHQRVGRSNAPWEGRRSERDYSGTSERRHHDDRELDWDRSEREQQTEEKDGYRDYRTRDRNYDKKVDWNRGQSSSRSRIRSYMQGDDDRSLSRDADYEKDCVKRRRE